LGALSYTHTRTTGSGNPNGSGALPTAIVNNDIKLSLTTGFSVGVAFYFGGAPVVNNNETGK
jgi:hypothetical protein